MADMATRERRMFKVDVGVVWACDLKIVMSELVGMLTTRMLYRQPELSC